jgi:ketosteroid isomerase-like protein
MKGSRALWSKLINTAIRTLVMAFLLTAIDAFRPAISVAGNADDVRALYDQFVAAQNARDLNLVSDLLLDSPKFLWVTDGMSVWGRQALIDRMAIFQQSEVWHVTPDRDQAVLVKVDGNSAFLHLPLELAIGSNNPGPDRLKFLVSVLCLKTERGWRIAALFTTRAKE